MASVKVFGSALHGDDKDGSDLGIKVDVLTPRTLPASFRDQVLAEARAL